MLFALSASTADGGISSPPTSTAGRSCSPTGPGKRVKALVEEGAKGLYKIGKAPLLRDKEVTPEAWRENLRELASRLRDKVRPDDLIVIFLAGHGHLVRTGIHGLTSMCLSVTTPLVQTSTKTRTVYR